MTRFLAVTDSASFVDRVAAALVGDDGSGVTAVPAEATGLRPEAILPPPGEEPIDVVLIGPGIERTAALRFAAALDTAFPRITLVLVDDPDPELAVAAMRAGVRDVIAPDADADALGEVLRRSSRAAQARIGDRPAARSGPQRKVVVVLSPKGGVGKTTLSVNLAVALGRVAPLSTVLVDLDAQFGDVASALGLDPVHTLRDAVGAAAASDLLVLKAYLAVHEAGFYSLSAPKDPADADRISSDAVSHLLRQLSSDFAYVVVDTSAGLTDHTLAALEIATDALFVTAMDVPGVRGLRRELTVLEELGLLPENRHLVVNLAEKKSGITVKDIEATVRMSVTAVVPRSADLALSVNMGQPLLLSKRRSRAAVLLGRLAGSFTGAVGTAPRRRVRIQ
ncbi:pilus assembly protein CpaE [Rathayibacter caricis DSM 15933]|uniref:Pilus assembly protein CpaE n=1 Tax=Rathayibacter caricis DSM 15933 TaxID=1328867 RepID=A0A2T4UPY6_9MICO|nr:AAA family ATPase [Rathayibacter caricis]PTL71602.1 pilus assembly protein CpaE [Rathayibacter caricis DSM 15933]